MTEAGVKTALELKGCPFCGGADIAENLSRIGGISCRSCGAEVFGAGARSDRETWNTRAALEAPVVGGGDLRAAISELLGPQGTPSGPALLNQLVALFERRSALSSSVQPDGLRDILDRLTGEVGAVFGPGFDLEIRRVLGNTNFQIIADLLVEARAALSSSPASGWRPTPSQGER